MVNCEYSNVPSVGQIRQQRQGYQFKVVVRRAKMSPLIYRDIVLLKQSHHDGGGYLSSPSPALHDGGYGSGELKNCCLKNVLD